MVLALAKSIYYTVPATCDPRFVQVNLANKCVIVGEKKINYIFCRKLGSTWGFGWLV